MYIGGLNFTTKPYSFDETLQLFFHFQKALKPPFNKTSHILRRMMVILVHDQLRCNRKDRSYFPKILKFDIFMLTPAERRNPKVPV